MQLAEAASIPSVSYTHLDVYKRQYTVTQLPPGYYSVKIDKAGFKLFEQSNINLQIDQVQLINAKLEVGSMGETCLLYTSVV